MAVDRVPVVPQKNAPQSSPTHSQTPENPVPLSLSISLANIMVTFNESHKAIKPNQSGIF
jgi:hypothetical protein